VRILRDDKFRANAINEARTEIKRLSTCIENNTNNIGEDTLGIQCIGTSPKTATGGIKMSFTNALVPTANANEENWKTGEFQEWCYENYKKLY
jgi:hypothetical protein